MPQVSVVTIHRQNVPVVFEVPGRTSAYRTAEVRARVEGIVLGRRKSNGPDQAKVTLLLEDGREYEHPGSLEATDISVDQGTGSVTVRALLPNPDSVLLPGMFARALIEGVLSENAFLVPQPGVTHDQQGRATALVVDQDGKVVLRTLQTAGTRGNQWIVEGGLEEGDRVIVSGLQKVQPGVTVQAVEEQSETAK